MQGLHLTADLGGCDPTLAVMTDVVALRTLCSGAAGAAGLTAVGECFHVFDAPGGVTGMLLLAESHLAVHTWPESGSVTLDVFVCNQSADNRDRAQALLHALTQAFAPAQASVQRLERATPTVDVP